MDELYRNVWSAAGCAGSAVLIGALSIAIIAVTILALWLIGRSAVIRSAPADDRLRSLRGIRIGAMGIGVLLSGLAIYVAMTGTVLHSARFGDERIALDYCDGVRARAERIAWGDVVAIRHRTITRETRTGTTYDDEAVLTIRTGSEFAIPLRLDSSVLDPAAVRRHLPTAVLEDWDRARQRRGAAPLPPEWRP